MAEVKPAEVSAILKDQLAGIDASSSLDEVGTVLEVGDGIARVYGLSNVSNACLCTVYCLSNVSSAYPMGVALV